jgi:hypothetical protein
MARQPLKPPAARLSGGATGRAEGERRFLSSPQFRGMRLELSDLDAKLQQMTTAERERRR